MKQATLNEEEMQALLEAMTPEEKASAMLASFPAMPQPEDIDDFSFREKQETNLSDYPRFTQMHDRFTEILATHWKATFSRNIPVFFKEGSEGSYFEALDSDESQVYFTIESPGLGYMTVAFGKALVLSYIDRMLSGSGIVIPDEDTQLTRLELKLAERIAATICDMLAELWAPVLPLDFKLYQIDLDLMNMLMTIEDETCFSITNVTVLGEEVRGEISLIYPFSFLEPMLINLRSSVREQVDSVDEEWCRHLKHALMKAPVELRLEVGRCQVRVHDFLHLKAGDFLPLKLPEDEPATIWIDEYPSYRARAGQQHGMLAAEILNPIKPVE